MLEASEAKELVDEAVERFEEHEAEEARGERRFRDRLSLLVGVFAVLLAVVHLVGAGYLRDNVVDTIQASDTYNYMQAKKIRQTILEATAEVAPPEARGRMLEEASALGKSDAKGHGIGQLQAAADRLAEEGARSGKLGEQYEWAEAALQMAIVLLSIAMIASSRIVAGGACLVAIGGIVIALATHFGALF